MRISVQQVGKVGVVKDIAGHLLPLNSWTDSNNVRFIDKKIVKWRDARSFRLSDTGTGVPNTGAHDYRAVLDLYVTHRRFRL